MVNPAHGGSHSCFVIQSCDEFYLREGIAYAEGRCSAEREGARGIWLSVLDFKGHAPHIIFELKLR